MFCITIFHKNVRSTQKLLNSLFLLYRIDTAEGAKREKIAEAFRLNSLKKMFESIIDGNASTIIKENVTFGFTESVYFDKWALCIRQTKTKWKK